MQTRLTLSSLVACTLVVSALSACDSAKPEAAKEKEEEIPSLQVNLPPSPNFEEGKAPEKYDDGSYSIYGLRSSLDERIAEGAAGTEVQVRGFVQEVYVPIVCPEGEFCPPGKQPHVWITDAVDTQGKKRAMMVVNYRFNIPEWEAEMWKGQPEVVLEKGQQYTFKGKFVRFSATGFAHDMGLLEFVAYKAKNPETGVEDWVYPPGAAWHPVTVAATEAQNAELAEKAAKAAEDYKKRGDKGE